nr:antirestriction protein [Mycolicibacterium malmesburyense]
MNETHHEPTEPEHQPEVAEHREKEPKPSPAIYVASLADYNNGVLHGTWIDAAREPEDIEADINTMLADSREPNAEEWAIFDYDQFGCCRIHEHDPIDLVARIARGIQEHGYAFAAWAEVHEGNPERWDDFTEAYLGHYDSVQDYADQLIDDLGYTDELAKLPESLRPYLRFDSEALARDMELSGDFYTVASPDGGVWIFQGNV